MSLSFEIWLTIKFIAAIFLFTIFPGFILIRNYMSRINWTMILPLSFFFSICYTEIVNCLLLPIKVAYITYFMMFFIGIIVLGVIGKNNTLDIERPNSREIVIIGFSLVLMSLIYFVVGPADDSSISSDLWWHLNIIRAIADSKIVELVDPFFGTGSMKGGFKYSTGHFSYAYIVRFASLKVEYFYSLFSWFLVVLSGLLVYGFTKELFENGNIALFTMAVFSISSCLWFGTSANGILAMKYMIYPNTTASALVVPSLFFLFFRLLKDQNFMNTVALFLGVFTSFRFHADGPTVFVLFSVMGLTGICGVKWLSKEKCWNSRIAIVLVGVLALYGAMMFKYYSSVPQSVKHRGRVVKVGDPQLVFLGDTLYFLHPKLFATKISIVAAAVAIVILITRPVSLVLVFMSCCMLGSLLILVNPLLIVAAGQMMNPPHVARIAKYLPCVYLIGYSLWWTSVYMREKVFKSLVVSWNPFLLGSLTVCVIVGMFLWVFWSNIRPINSLAGRKNSEILFNKDVKKVLRGFDSGQIVLSDSRTNYLLPLVNQIKVIMCAENVVKRILDKSELAKRERDHEMMLDPDYRIQDRLKLFNEYDVRLIFINLKHTWYKENDVRRNKRNISAFDSNPDRFNRVYSSKDYLVYNIVN